MLKRYDNYALSVSATTSSLGRKDGEDYFFVSREYFQQMMKAGVWWVRSVREPLHGALGIMWKMAEERTALLELKFGRLKVKKRFPTRSLIYSGTQCRGFVANLVNGERRP